MEKFGQATVVAFDKTGTLTEGTPRVAEIHPVPAAGFGTGELLALAAAAERPSEHPIARAIVAAAVDRGVAMPAAEGCTSVPGQGVSASVTGRRVRVGAPALLGLGVPAGRISGRVPDPAVRQAHDLVERLEAGGRTVVVVLVDDVPAAVLAVTDRLRPEARETVAALATLPHMVGLSQRAHRVVQANLTFAAAVIVALVAWDIIGTLPLPLGVAGHEGSTVIVGLNGLRLLHARAWRLQRAAVRQ